MDESHDLEHEKANSQFQYTFFREIITQTDPNAEVRVLHTYADDINSFSYDDYDVFMWTGGLGNIYLSNQHNQNQLKVCEKILKLEKPLWGSCWGLQVIATCYGDKITKTEKFEFGFAENIEIIKNHYVYENKKNYFTAPGHHYDHLEKINSDFEVISQNEISIQAISHKNKKIFCTQYHPELPFNFIGKLMKYWKNNYLKIFNSDEFDNRLILLNQLEQENYFNRRLEIENWLKNN